jgi:chorismate mutase/prephenate dehydrogenase
LTATLIQYSCLLQEEFQSRNRQPAPGSQRQVLVVGGLGPMGGWCAQFFETFGHSVSLSDVKAGPSPYPMVKDLAEGLSRAEVVVLATPISRTAEILDQITEMASRSGTRALVFDICSLKTPLLPAIEKARAAGVRIASAHPMFGPSVELLSGRNILICDAGQSEAADEVERLFKDCTAKLVRIPLAQHDRQMAYILGVSHLTRLVFAETCADGGIPFEDLAGIGSTTFNAQVKVSEAVLKENPDLYYEIQAENRFSSRLVANMENAIARYARAVRNSDRAGFKALMERGRRYFFPEEKTP